MTPFSERHGYQPDDPEITVRLDAPDELRGIIVDLAYESGLTPDVMRSLVCQVLRTREDPNNWSAYPDVDDEVRRRVDTCEWYEVYDILEAVHERLPDSRPWKRDGKNKNNFEAEVNKYFRRRGIGWQLINGQLETRGSEGFEHTLSEARRELADSGRITATNEIHQAISDLSRRPRPDITGAIQHALAALECGGAGCLRGRESNAGRHPFSGPWLGPASAQ